MDFINSLFGGNQQPSGPGGLGSAYIPPFISSGGITPEQEALASYTQGEGDVGVANEFGASGTGESTMETQAGTGVDFGAGQQRGQMSDINQGAFYQRYLGDVGNQLTDLNTLAQEQAAGLAASNAQAGQTANALGQLVGKNAPNLFGTNTGSLTTGTS